MLTLLNRMVAKLQRRRQARTRCYPLRLRLAFMLIDSWLNGRPAQNRTPLTSCSSRRPALCIRLASVSIVWPTNWLPRRSFAPRLAASEPRRRPLVGCEPSVCHRPPSHRCILLSAFAAKLAAGAQQTVRPRSGGCRLAGRGSAVYGGR